MKKGLDFAFSIYPFEMGKRTNGKYPDSICHISPLYFQLKFPTINYFYSLDMFQW